MQFVMHRPNLDDLPKMPGPAEQAQNGINIRAAALDDAPDLARILTAAFSEEWSVERVHKDLLQAGDVRRTYLVEVDGKVGATASAQTVPDRWPDSGVVHWVGADPAVAGRRLGYLVSLAVLHDHKAAGHPDVYLLTDDHRRAAIRTYLRLGFELSNPTQEQADRWKEIMAEFAGKITLRRRPETALVTRAEPLDSITIHAPSDLRFRVSDGTGRQYASLQGGESFIVGGALGTHRVSGPNGETAEFLVEAKTKIDDVGGRFNDLLTMLHFTMLSEQGEEHTCLWNGKIYRYFICWLRDHVHVLKGMKYFEPDIKSAIELYRDSQREDGMVWDNIYRRGPDPNYWQVRFTEGDFYRPFEDKTFEFKRIPVENDVEYLFVEGVYNTWKATGDDAWMSGCMDAAVRALEYSVTSDYRWSEKLGLLKRGYTIDTWDFQVEGDRVEGDIMRIRPGETRFGAMFGDTTGYIAACRQLAEMLVHEGRQSDAQKYVERATQLEKRLEEVSWRGTHFQHQVPEDPTVVRDLGVDETQQISLSNAYSLNRGIADDKARAIIESYQKIRDDLPEGSPGEWYTVYPPFERGFGDHSSKWQYMNASVTPIVAGELAHGAFQHGHEAYGADILIRLIDLAHKHGNRFHCSYTGSLPHEVPPKKSIPLELGRYANADVRSSGGGDIPGWPNMNGNDLRELPTGHQVFSGVDVLLLEGPKNAVALGNGYADQVKIEVDQHAKSIYFFHTMSGNDGGGIAGTVRITYEDGAVHRQYIVRNRDILGFWMPELPNLHGPRNLDIGWKGANEVLPYVGVSTFGLRNPNPEKKIDRIVLERSAENLQWFVMGITLSESDANFPPSPISFGIPNGWGSAAVVYALVEGLAGVVDAGTAFKNINLSPRWSTAEVHEVQTCITYPASGGYVAYRYKATEHKIDLVVTGSGESATLSLLLPCGQTGGKVEANGQAIPFTHRQSGNSWYVEFAITLPGPIDTRITLQATLP